MVKDDVLPQLAHISPPGSITAAANRIRDCGGADTFYGLIGCVFLDVAQFVAGMRECGINCKVDELMSNGTVVTYKAALLTAHGGEWRFILNATGPYRLDVVNCKILREGTVDPASSDIMRLIKNTLTEAE